MLRPTVTIALIAAALAGCQAMGKREEGAAATQGVASVRVEGQPLGAYSGMDLRLASVDDEPAKDPYKAAVNAGRREFVVVGMLTTNVREMLMTMPLARCEAVLQARVEPEVEYVIRSDDLWLPAPNVRLIDGAGKVVTSGRCSR